MQVNRINQQNTQKAKTFKGVNIFRNEWTGRISIGVWVTKAAENNVVEFVNGRTSSHNLGMSKNAKKATEMLNKLGEKILDPKQIKKIRKLLKKVVERDIKEELERPRLFFNNQTYKVKDDVIGKTSLTELSKVIKKGKPEYHPQGSNSPNSYEVFSLELNP